LVTAAIAAAIFGVEIAVTDVSGLHGGPAFDLWVVMVPAITAGVEAGRRLPSRREGLKRRITLLGERADVCRVVPLVRKALLLCRDSQSV
jgi:hypothetical protein